MWQISIQFCYKYDLHASKTKISKNGFRMVKILTPSCNFLILFFTNLFQHFYIGQ